MTTKSIIKIGKLFSILSLIAITFFACQDEIIEVTPPDEQETITQNSNLAILIQNTALLDGSFDNILDGANCITINLPVTVIVNGVEVTVDSEEDYEVIEAIFDEFANDEDNIEIVFPIVIVLNDYTTVEIANQDELIIFIDECLGENEDDEDIECIDFQYPITFSIYDSNFQVTETVIIENDEALYIFIENLEGGVLASLNFPVTMILSDGSTVEVNNNEELQAIIEAAEDDCDEDDDNDYDDDDCTEESIELALKECIWNIVNYNGNSSAIIENDIDFIEDYTFTVTLNNNVVHEGTWSVTENNDSFILTFDTNWDDIDGNWEIVDCDDDRIELVSPISTMVIEQDCEENENPFACFESFDAIIYGCDDDNDGFGAFDLETVFANCENNSSIITFHETLPDAQANTNALISPYSNITSPPQVIYARVELLSNGNFEVFNVNLVLEDCNTSGCTEAEVDAYLQTCIWNVVNLNGSDSLINYDLDFNNDGTVLITGNGQTITGMWSTSQTADGIFVEFDGINGANIQAITGNWLLVECDPDRLQLGTSTQIMILEQDCTDDGLCTESEVDAILMECEWQIALYVGDAGFNIFYINFLDAQSLTIESASESYTGNWTSSQDGDFVYIEFTNISGGNVQVFNGINFKVVECTTEQMILHDVTDSNNELVLDRYCN